jgi:predicted TIM-barrel fold metal-dependent hydrolase
VNTKTVTFEVPELVFDVHQHVGAIAVAEEHGGSASDMDTRIGMMKEAGIDFGCLSPSLQYERPNGWRDTVDLNDRIAAYRRQRADVFPVAFGAVDLVAGTANAVAEARRLGAELGLAGINWHHRYQGLMADDRRMHAVLDVCAELGLVAAIHLFADSTMENPDALERLATAHPEVTFLGLDALSGFAQSRALHLTLERCPNVLIDTAGCFGLARVIDSVVSNFGAERVLFGTDLYTTPRMWNYPAGLIEVSSSKDLTDADKAQITYGNAARLFRLADKEG